MQQDPDGPREPDDAADAADAAEAAWRAIVDNYGDRPQLDDPPAQSSAQSSAQPPEPSAAPFGGRFGDLSDFDEDEDDPSLADEERYEPPPPPPLPTVAPDRLLAWLGVFGSPAVLLTALVLGIGLPGWAGYLLVVAFVGGFAYLVYRMPRGPRDPWDDGAQV